MGLTKRSVIGAVPVVGRVIVLGYPPYLDSRRPRGLGEAYSLSTSLGATRAALRAGTSLAMAAVTVNNMVTPVPCHATNYRAFPLDTAVEAPNLSLF
jgi:hypothetical protein